jgi:DNA-binding CsgD family transcriptional regulator
MRWLATSLCSVSRGSEALPACRASVAFLEALGPSAELAWACASLATHLMVRYQNDESISLARHAQAIAEPLGLTEVLSDALNTEACALHTTGADWTAVMRAALDIGLSGGHDAQAGRAYVNFYAIYVAERQFAESEPYYTDGVAYCDEHDLTSYSIFLRSERTSMLERTGRWDEVIAIAEEMLRRGGPSPNIRLCPQNRLGTVRARRGEPGAWESLDEAIRTAEAADEAQSILPIRLARAEAAWLEGDEATALREAELADDCAAHADAWERGAVAVWLVRTGSARGPRGTLAEPYQRQLDGDWAEAARLWEDLGCPYEAALARLASTEEHALREALRTFTDLGANPAVRVARKKMRSLGIRSIPAGPRTTTRAHPLGLTRREHEVLDLIVDGNTNAEIAEQLFISAKTGDHHVSAVLAKLGAPSRNVAASEAVRLGLARAAKA